MGDSAAAVRQRTQVQAAAQLSKAFFCFPKMLDSTAGGRSDQSAPSAIINLRGELGDTKTFGL